jgi:hypothetical protein
MYIWLGHKALLRVAGVVRKSNIIIMAYTRNDWKNLCV